ncbi:uridine diphosphate-N-acetylglucosamine-binding protein YvcK [Chloroflexota bacterium]
MRKKLTTFRKWLSPGLSIKRWLLLIIVGILFLSMGVAQVILALDQSPSIVASGPSSDFLILLTLALGTVFVVIALYELNDTILTAYRVQNPQPIVDAMYDQYKRKQGITVVAIGGGTGLPSVLRSLKHLTSNLSAIVTVADDGGSSGRLRRTMGILPPGDLRNNIAALADDEEMMTQLFQYRFSTGDLDGHSFGNLFLTALSDITGSMDRALLEAARVLAVQGSVLPATLDNVTLVGEIWLPEKQGLQTVTGESEIPETGGKIERVFLEPPTTRAYPKSVQAILGADLIVIGPGSVYTSILPSLLVNGITEALRASNALIVYVCNVATQPGETDDFDVSDHVVALEKHVGSGLFQIVLANNHFPSTNASATQYVRPAQDKHEITTRYEIVYADLTDAQYPWRHDPAKLVGGLQYCFTNYQAASLQKIKH